MNRITSSRPGSALSTPAGSRDPSPSLLYKHTPTYHKYSDTTDATSRAATVAARLKHRIDAFESHAPSGVQFGMIRPSSAARVLPVRGAPSIPHGMCILFKQFITESVCVGCYCRGRTNRPSRECTSACAMMCALVFMLLLILCSDCSRQVISEKVFLRDGICAYCVLCACFKCLLCSPCWPAC